MNSKTCSKCGQDKTLSSFYKRSDRLSGYVSACKACHSHYERTVNKEAQAVRARKSWLKTQYSITPEKYEEMSLCQGHCCAICGTPKDTAVLGKGLHFHVDHNHKTGAVRGLLCLPCNTLLGKSGDSPEVLKNAAKYLEEKGYYG